MKWGKKDPTTCRERESKRRAGASKQEVVHIPIDVPNDFSIYYEKILIDDLAT